VYFAELMNLISAAVIMVLSFGFIVQFSHPYKSVHKVRVYTFLFIVCSLHRPANFNFAKVVFVLINDFL
jgi:hypothetical protein